MSPERLIFGPYTLTAAALLRNGTHVPLGGRALAILKVLARATGQVVPKGDLMDQVWPGLAVEEGNLTVQIAALRKALGQTPEGQDWIGTVPRVGYRLATPQVTPVTAMPRLAVMPFRNLGGTASDRADLMPLLLAKAAGSRLRRVLKSGPLWSKQGVVHAVDHEPRSVHHLCCHRIGGNARPQPACAPVARTDRGQRH